MNSEIAFFTLSVTWESLVIEVFWKPHGRDVTEGPREENKYV